MDIDYSIIHLPLHIKPFQKNETCRFCSHKFENGFIVSTQRGGYLVCTHCKDKIVKYVEGTPEKENLINKRNIFSGGSWESNRSKH